MSCQARRPRLRSNLLALDRSRHPLQQGASAAPPRRPPGLLEYPARVSSGLRSLLRRDSARLRRHRREPGGGVAAGLAGADPRRDVGGRGERPVRGRSGSTLPLGEVVHGHGVHRAPGHVLGSYRDGAREERAPLPRDPRADRAPGGSAVRRHWHAILHVARRKVGPFAEGM
jgi:hypothetical protein